ncbi:MAG TPA: hypothetical protein VF485_17630 [Sphingomonas sp.]
MNENRSFVITLVLAVMSGAVIGLIAFGATGKGSQPAPAAVAAPDPSANAAAPSAPSPSTPAPEPMAPVQYDDPDAGNAPAATPTDDATVHRPILS